VTQITTLETDLTVEGVECVASAPRLPPVFTVGATVLLVGIVMLITPGPGWAAVFVGFAILATEFVWARRALRRAKLAAQRAKEKALDPKVRRRNAIIAVVLGLLGGLAAIWYLAVFGLSAPWM
jgi:uncharacterized protein (TIGR02611 family)